MFVIETIMITVEFLRYKTFSGCFSYAKVFIRVKQINIIICTLYILITFLHIYAHVNYYQPDN